MDRLHLSGPQAPGKFAYSLGSQQVGDQFAMGFAIVQECSFWEPDRSWLSLRFACLVVQDHADDTADGKQDDAQGDWDHPCATK